MGDYMVIGIVLVFVVLMSILPKPVYNAITRAILTPRHNTIKNRHNQNAAPIKPNSSPPTAKTSL